MAAPLLLHVYATFAVGGPQVRFAALVNRFGRDFRHAVIAMDGNLAARERLDAGLDVTWPQVDIRQGDTLGNRRRFRAVLRTMRPDALVTSNWGSIEWAMANTPTLVRHIHIEDGFGPEEREHQLPRRVWTRRLLLRRATVAMPSRVLWCLAEQVWRLPLRHLCYIPNGIDLSRFAASSRPPSVAPVIGTVAALRPEKNLARLIRAFAQVHTHTRCRLVIAGDGPSRPGLEALTLELGVADAVSFLGHVSDTPALYAGFDVFALSSDTEQMPLSVLEAMAAGLPVVSTDVGDVRAMLAPANAGFVVPMGDEAALADALSTLLADAALRARLSVANRRRAEVNFDQETMFVAWHALFAGTLPPVAPL